MLLRAAAGGPQLVGVFMRVLCFLALFFVLQVQSFSQPFLHGVQTHFGQFYRADMDSANVLRMLDSIRSAGIQFIRDECYWADVEKTRGVFTFPPQVDFYVAEARRRGINVLLILNYNNPLYAAHAGAAVTTDSNRVAYAAYCRQAVLRYFPMGVTRYELWNEPNIPQFWAPSPSAQDYFKLVREAYPVIKQAAPSAEVLACATSPAEGNPAPAISWLTFISSFVQAGGLNYCDAVSFHQYRVDKQPEAYILTDLNNLAAITQGKRLWLTETGYPTSSVWPNITTAAQGYYLPRLFLLARHLTAAPVNLAGISWYDFKDDGTEPANNEHNFGITTFTLAPKPSVIAYKAMLAETSGKTFVSGAASGTYYKDKFGSAGAPTWAVWATAAASPRTEPFGTNWLRVRGGENAPFYVYDKDRTLLVAYTPAPVYYTELTVAPVVQSLTLLPQVDTVVAGQSVSLSVRGFSRDSLPVLIDSTAAVWSVTGASGGIDSAGRFTARSAGVCTVTCAFGTVQVSKVVSVIASYNYFEVEPYSTQNSFTVAWFNMLPSSSVTITDTGFTTPPAALRVTYAFRYMGADKHRALLDANYPLPGEPDSILIDVYNNGNGNVIGYVVEDADGQLFSLNSQPGMLGTTVGWRTVKLSLRGFGSSFNFPARLRRVLLYAVKSGGIVDSLYTGVVLLDNLRIHNGIISGIPEESPIPRSSMLHQNYPNPFNPETEIRFSLHSAGPVWLSIYNVLGGRVADLETGSLLAAGTHTRRFNAAGLVSGIYFCCLRAGNRSVVKMVLAK